MNFPDDDLEFQRCWSNRAGHLAQLGFDIAEIQARAAAFFVKRMDQAANAMRDLAVHLDYKAKEISSELDAYKKEDCARQYERRKKMGLP